MPYQYRPIVVRRLVWDYDPDTGIGAVRAVVQQGNEMRLQQWNGPVEYGPQLEVEESIQFIPLNPRLLDRVPLGPRLHRLDFRVDLYGAQSSTQTIGTFSD